MWIMGRAKTSPATRSTHVEMNMFMNLPTRQSINRSDLHGWHKQASDSRELYRVRPPDTGCACRLKRLVCSDRCQSRKSRERSSAPPHHSQYGRGSRRRRARSRKNEREADQHRSPTTRKRKTMLKAHLQKPEKLASFAGSLDMAPMNQYAVVCHIASRRPQKM